MVKDNRCDNCKKFIPLRVMAPPPVPGGPGWFHDGTCVHNPEWVGVARNHFCAQFDPMDQEPK